MCSTGSPRLPATAKSMTLALALVVWTANCNNATGNQVQASGGASASGGSNGFGGAISSGGSSVASGGATSGVGGVSSGGAGGGPIPTGGSAGGGATTASGGTLATGGAGTAGAPATGGATGAGGVRGNGGVTGSGGGAAAGGATAAVGGAAAGGARAGGGTTGTGGTLATGGSSVVGGTTTAGGASGTGGTPPAVTGHFQMEDLDRGVVAVKVSSGVYVGWRMFGYEYDKSSPSNVAYNVYRGTTKLATVTDSTNYLDASGTSSSTYAVSAVIGGTEGAQSPQATVWAQNYLRIPLTPPGSTYEANDGSPGDLDGDGKYEIVLKWQPANAQDNSNSGVTDNTYLDGLKLDGTRMWRIDLGRNIRSGAHYTQFSVYDFDGDGKAEIAVKTAPGTKDGKGAYLHLGPAASDDDSADYRNSDGYILSGPEYLTVFSGETGEELATIDFPVPRGTVSSWGDSYGNRVDRFNSGVAFVSDTGSGKTATGRPSIIMQRGYYTRLTMTALNWRDGKLTKVWTFDSNGSGNSKAAGQGDHSAMAADTDGDGAQEIITGALTIGSDGTFRCSTNDGHGDALHVGELVVGKGISVFSVHEGTGGYDVHNGNTCSFYVNVTGGGDNGRGVADDVDPSSPGAEMWSATSTGLFSCATGATITSSEPPSQNFLIYWDADESREVEDAATIKKASGTSLLSASGCSGNNGTKNTPTLTADLLGDWREELVVRESNNTGLRVYTTTDVTKRRIYTLMHDPTYRMQVSFEQASYNQPPHTGFHIGNGMADPPKPDIFVK
jgi:rhamnogalacturonan endolyase